MPQTESWTIGRLLQWTTDYLRKGGSRSPRLDAEVLLARALACRRIDLYTAFDEIPSEPTREVFRELVRRRAAGKPVAYLVGQREFYSLPFHVTPDVLIPRPETEFVVVALLDAVKEMDVGRRPVEIADVGTGCGVLAVCAAKHVPNCRVTAIDISRPALEVARINVDKHGVADRLELVEGDLLSCLVEDRKFDFVVSNPPYVSQSEFGALPAEIRDHEPRAALLAGATGVEIIVRLVPQAGDRLRAGGWLITEISPMVERRVYQIINEDGRFGPPGTIKDLAGLARVVRAERRED